MSDYNPIKLLRQNGKTININDLPPEAWNVVLGGNQGDGLQNLYSRVSWVFRSMDILYNNMMQLPFVIESAAGDEIDNSRDYQNAIGFLPYPGELFGLSEMAMNAFGYNYLYRRPNLLGNKVFELRYMVPSSVNPEWQKNEAGKITGLAGFRRKGAQDLLAVEAVVYFWRPDPYVEYGPPQSSPLQAAASEAGVILNVNKFAEMYFASGAIKATLLAVSGNPPDTEKSRIKAMWGRMFKGLKNVGEEMVINADSLKPIIIGEGLEALSDKNLTNEKREAIASALGIPHSMLFSSSAKGLGGGGVAEQDEVNLYKQKIIPDAKFLQEKLNKQLFVPMGYKLKFTPETMDLFQVDESVRAASVKTFIETLGMVKSLDELRAAAIIYGYEISEEAWVFLEKAFAERKQRAEAMTENLKPVNNPQDEAQTPQAVNNQPPVQEPPQKRTDMDRYKTKVLKALKAGKSPAVSFESDEIPPAINGAIYGALETAKTVGDVELIFSDAWVGYP